MKNAKWTKSNKHFEEILKYAVVGGINTAIDLAVLNFLILVFHTGKTGFYYGLFKTISFLVAIINSYYMNRNWTFTAGQAKKKMHLEIGQFFFISLIGLVINVVVATAFVSSVHASAGLEKAWPTIGALAGTVVGMIWNYFGYKFFVFKEHSGELLPPA